MLTDHDVLISKSSLRLKIHNLLDAGVFSVHIQVKGTRSVNKGALNYDLTESVHKLTKLYIKRRV